MADPTLYVEAALGYGPYDLAPVWTDLSEWCEGFSSRRGRFLATDAIEAATGEVLFRSPDDARFDPNNPDGPYYPNLIPTVPIRVLADTSGSYTPGGPWVSTNLLTVNQASIETDTTGWSASGSSSIARSTAQALDGAASLALTADASPPGSMSASTPSGASGIAVSPSTQYTALAYFRAATTARSTRVQIEWYDSGGSSISTSFGSNSNDSTSAWTLRSVTDTSPSNAAFARVVCRVNAPAGSETHYIDQASLHSGSSTTWALPGALLLAAGAEPIVWARTEAWPQDFTDRFDVEVPVEFTDAFQGLSLNRVTATYSSELTGTRINNALDDAGWPDGDDWRDIDAGQSTMQAQHYTSTAPLTICQFAATTEGGTFKIDRYGRASFKDRLTQWTTTLDTDLTYGDDASERPYADMVGLGADASLLIYNVIEVSADGLTTQTVTDSASVTSHDRRVLPIETGLTTEAEMLSRAQYARGRYSQPQQRVKALVLDGQGTDQWPSILAREVGDKVRVRRRPEGGSYTIEQDSVIEAIEFDVRPPNDWQVTWTLSPADAGSNIMLADDPVAGRADANRAGY